MKSLGIKYQLRITTLIPVFIVALLFAVFYNGQFNRDLDQHTSRLGEAYIHQLLPAAQLALLRDDNRTLQGLVDASTVNPEIQSLAFYNAKGQLLAYRGGKHLLNERFKPPGYTGDHIENKKVSPYRINFIAPINVPRFNLYSTFPLPAPKNPVSLQADNILGWLSIDIDTKATLIKRYQMYIVTIFITLFGLLVGLSSHSILAKKIYIPIARLRRSMKQISSNEFETKIKISSRGEIGTIERGCVHLQRQYLDTIKDLNQYIEVATADLHKNLELLEEKNIELSLDKRKTEEKSRQKSEFIANMSHEIRTPMNAVIGFSNLLFESNLDTLQLDYVKTIRSSAEDLLVIINDILDYSKMDAGQLKLDCIPMDIRTCLDDVLALMAPNAHKKGIDLIPATETNVPKTVLGDPLRLKQIVSNLVNNAIKFTDHGYVLVRTKVEKETEKEYCLSLSVIDTGIGIAQSDQSALFNAFNQADTTITRRYGGSGLGLVICKKLAEHMQGRITLSSELHKGSTFTVYLKLSKLASYEVEKHQTHRFSHLKVLCFDDNPLYLETLCNGLGNWGIQCVRVETFHKLEHALKSNQDCQLAFINVNQGCEKQIEQIIKKQTIPCVVMSKWPIQEYQTLGASAFLFKPPNIQKLHDTIESLIHHTSSSNNQEQKLDTLRAQFRLEQPNLLIAEDNAVNRKLLHSLLGENAAYIDTAYDGEQAVHMSQKKRFDAILLDLQMPKISGLEAARLIRKHGLLNNNTPIILISANSLQNHDLLQKNGIDLCLQKPVQEIHLLSQLLKIIKKNKATAINWSLCVQRASGNPELAAELLAHFVKELPETRRKMIQLVRAEDIQSIEKEAHKLRGACCFCGVPDLQNQLANIERLAQDTKNIDEIQAEMNFVIQSMDSIMTEYTQSYKITTAIIN